MRYRKITAMISAALLIGSIHLWAGGGEDGASREAKLEELGFQERNLPITTKKSSLKVFFEVFPEQTLPFNSMPIVQQVEEDTNVSIEWVTAMTADMNQKINLLFASGDLPDIFLNGLQMENAYNYGLQGLIRPLDDLVNSYAPTLKRMIGELPGLKETVTAPDGKMYTLFGLGNAYHQDLGKMLYINRDWLKAVGMDMPATTDEYHEVLKAFKDNDLNGNGVNDEIPLGFTFYTKNTYWSDLVFFGAFGINMDPDTNFLYLNEGNVAWAPASEEFRNTLKWLNTLYSEGLIDQEAYIHDKAQMKGRGTQKPPVYGSYVSWFNINVAGDNGRFYDIVGPLEGPEGYSYAAWQPRQMAIAGSGVITARCMIPEVAVRWLDYIYQPEINIQMAYGREGEAVRKNEDGRWEILPPPDGISAEEYRMMYSPHHVPFTFPQYLKTIDPPHFQEKDRAKRELFLDHLPEDITLPVFYLSRENQDVVDAVLPDITTLAEQRWASWVMNGNIDSEWDAYIKQINAMGLPKMLEVYQREYEAFLSSNP